MWTRFFLLFSRTTKKKRHFRYTVILNGIFCAMFRNGNPVIVYGLEAVKTWAYCALRTMRFRHIIYTHNYGNEIESLIGKPFSTSVKTAEAKRYIEECLTVSPYIRSVTDISVAFSDGKLSIDCSINTVYGREGVKINV